MRPLLSVIIPAYNEEAFLPKCLASLKKQRTHVPFETIVVDNNSTDKTQNIAKQYGCRVIFEPKKGASAARNTGARYAKGDILIFLDADCIAPSDHIEIIFQFFTTHPNESIVAGPYFYMDAPPFIRWFLKQGNFYSLYFSLIRMLFGVQIILGGNFAIRKDVFEDIGGFDEKIRSVMQAEDAEFTSHLHHKGYSVVFEPKLTVTSSFRRIKKSPVRTGVVRMLYTFKYLFFT